MQNRQRLIEARLAGIRGGIAEYSSLLFLSLPQKNENAEEKGNGTPRVIGKFTQQFTIDRGETIHQTFLFSPFFSFPLLSLPLPFLSNVQLEFTAESSIAERQAECRLDRKWFVLSEKCGVTHNLTHRFSNRAYPTNAVFIFIYAVDQLLQYTISAVITYSSRVSLARGSIMAGEMRAEPRLRIRKENWNPNPSREGEGIYESSFFLLLSSMICDVFLDL